ncbi:MAG TPA: sirohydrochlorin chelatase [Pseudonocardia sp.]|uniref:sirohydrochlorin chelatase n=1 Tax=Pseudonocardia sp. TaxID=60912 RepID=UPI002BD9E0B9|nr:sirohydrochlorin chelatase [Pseudonocardia sp.]HTF49822.1 sirohydrochlorin chelatase [Pseudonocardia sp.]
MARYLPSAGSALVAVAHGSRDPRSAATISALVDEVRRQRPDLDVRLSFLDLSTPRLSDVLTAVAADGHRDAVVVPLLLGNAFHARVDVPGVVARAARRYPRLRLSVAQVLGGDPRLATAALGRLARAAGPLDDPELGVVLAATGSSRASANNAVHRLASSWASHHPWRGCLAAFATDVNPSVPEAVARLRAAGAARIAVASWFLAPGLLPTRVHTAALTTAPDATIAAPLGPDPSVAAVVVDRYLAAAHATTERAAG